MADLVLVENLECGIVSVMLNRPERRNALCIELVEQLCGTIERLASDTANRVVILRGAGPVFSAGLDLREAADGSLVERSAASVSRLLDLVRATPLVMIAVVQGGAFAGGAGVRYYSRGVRREDRISRGAARIAAGADLRRAQAQSTRGRFARAVSRG